MKALQTLLNVVARKKPRQVFSSRVGSRTVRAIEQEFTLESAGNNRQDSIQVEYSSGRQALPPGGSTHFITVKAASDKFRIPIRTLQQLCRDQRIICRRQGRGDNSPWLVAEESLKAYCNAQGS